MHDNAANHYGLLRLMMRFYGARDQVAITHDLLSSAVGPYDNMAKCKNFARTTGRHRNSMVRLNSLVRTTTRSYNHVGRIFSPGGFCDLAWMTAKPITA
jgi:hypothetical protein